MLRRAISCCRQCQHINTEYVTRDGSHVTRDNGHVTLAHTQVSKRRYVTNKWSDLDLHPALTQRLADVNFEHPTPIQARVSLMSTCWERYKTIL